MNYWIEAGGRRFPAAAGTRLSEALAAQGLPLETPCGARGYCRKCVVQVRGKAPAPTAADQEQLTPAELAAGFRLACQLRVAADLSVAVVPAVGSDGRKAALGKLTQPVKLKPWVPLRPTGPTLGFALDVGTTTLAGGLLDLRTGEELAARSEPNPQGVHGADVMSRLGYAVQSAAGARELQDLVQGAAGRLLEELCRQAGVEREAVVVGALCGNTAMHHLFLGLPVTDLALAPYRPVQLEGCEVELPGLPRLYALPNVGGFVGADAAAAALAAGLDQEAGTVLVVDVGTNGEAFLCHGGALFACSAPAGPAFEGGEISCGMRARPGAVEGVAYQDGRLELQVVGRKAPRGLCGSGLLDAAAALRKAGAVDATGRLRPVGPLAAQVAPDGSAVALAPGLLLTQKDIRALQLAKGAVRAAVDLLLQVAGVRPSALDAVLLAGAFGTYLRPESALAVGLLPPVALEKVRPIGNAAAAGTKLVLLSREARERVEALARRTQHVELATHPDFEEIFMTAMQLSAD